MTLRKLTIHLPLVLTSVAYHKPLSKDIGHDDANVIIIIVIIILIIILIVIIIMINASSIPHQRFDYELFNCNNFNIRYWSWNYRGCWHQTCPPIDPR